ncbi:Uncharacterised protein [Neisseria meningitidis]|nr:Uncharacterised protein [Neisseria meningitidis]CWP88813.1 Uncharacterised protein [Neisseria meningitidis]CWQ32642.1 Uncharacterised protein [Neisseria meningitidis]CWT54235.1 Uncharacterised protein [Neisseria meningitidis]CWT80082.1 Uncharacterised protein [Neisseria meningitidis]
MRQDFLATLFQPIKLLTLHHQQSIVNHMTVEVVSVYEGFCIVGDVVDIAHQKLAQLRAVAHQHQKHRILNVEHVTGKEERRGVRPSHTCQYLKFTVSISILFELFKVVFKQISM